MYHQFSDVMGYVNGKGKYQYLLLTLTIRNMQADKLADSLDIMFRAYNNLTKLKAIKLAVKGMFRSLEVTHNKKRGDYHPHFHVILAVGETYGQKGSEYITHSDFVKMWRNCLGVDYDPNVDIRSIKSDNKLNYNKAVAELTKYTVKSKDIIYQPSNRDIHHFGLAKAQVLADQRTDSAIDTLDKSLHGRRLVAYGGVLKDAHRALRLDDAIDGDLLHTDGESQVNEDLAYILVRYIWNRQYLDYVASQEKIEPMKTKYNEERRDFCV